MKSITVEVPAQVAQDFVAASVSAQRADARREVEELVKDALAPHRKDGRRDRSAPLAAAEERLRSWTPGSGSEKLRAVLAAFLLAASTDDATIEAVSEAVCQGIQSAGDMVPAGIPDGVARGLTLFARSLER